MMHNTKESLLTDVLSDTLHVVLVHGVDASKNQKESPRRIETRELKTEEVKFSSLFIAHRQEW